MSTEMPAALPSEAAETKADAQAATREWIAIALTAAAVLFVSFFAAVTGLV